MTSYIFTIATLGALVVATVLGAGAGGGTQLSGVGMVSFTKLGAAVRNGTSSSSSSSSSNGLAPATDRANRTSEVPAKVRPAYTRTELKVSRSLNPDNVQKLNVRSNNGRMVQIIVKKRTGMELPVANRTTATSGTSTTPAVSVVKTPETRIAGQYRLSSADSAPESVDLVNAFLEHVNRVERPVRASSPFYDEEHDGSMKNDRRPVRIKVSDEAVQETRVPAPVVISSDPVYMKDNVGATKTVKRGRSMQEIGPDGIPVVHGIRVPDDESDKRQVWRNARVINGELVPYEKGHVPTKLENGGDIYGQLIFAKPLSGRGAQPGAPSAGVRQRSIGPFTKADNFQPSESFKGFGPFSVEDNLHSGSVAINPEGPRVTGNIGPFSRADNSRPNSNARLVEYLRKINEEERRKHYPQIVSRANFKEDPIAALEQPKIQRRMLQNPGNPNYPVSQLYSINGAAGNQEKELEDARKPVLQYAHPELGVQPAKPVPPVERKPTKAMKKILNVQPQQQQQQQLQQPQSPDYYNKAVHNDHSPYAIEPAMGSKDYYDLPQQHQQQQHHHQQPGPMVKMPRHPQQYENFKGPSTYPYNYGYIRRVKHEPPFWVKITDQMRDSLQNGISSVQEFTKPVLEPIVEAGQKISKNLGFVRKSDEAQDKVGVVVAPATNSIILPALGLMAGGAALGLGAVAVGRFFDMGLLRRSGADFFPIDLDELEHKRALEAIGQYQQQQQQHPDPYYTMMVNPAGDQTPSNGRSKRAIEEHSLQDVELSSASSSRVRFEQQLRQTNWKNPACAKRTFCQVMIQQGADDVVLMEKKMYTMLDMMPPALAATLTDHLSEVTDAIRQNDCSRFACQSPTVSPDHRRS
ncbi:uncharacterized protein LOC118458967 isoform X2 [Anopheles albimanus]|uniref:Uncharacterized protein n=1 Tax=Anopheles albimanus TaxID=7167 RepID=A0A182F7S1_ANOAL|nr:uncharacterized protein LOC118458967 isoform X2 [Anopheles albimanus]XP_035777845.1 uncharacterized protein LOC118458967 isoform X2 [Anopheles albimanus]